MWLPVVLVAPHTSLTVWLTTLLYGCAAARALRGANTRTNFVTAIACEGAVPATTSKAARLIRLRQIAAAKECEKLEAEQKLGHGANQMMRQDSNHQRSISSDLDRHGQVTTAPRLISPSPLKPARQIGRRHNASPFASPAKADPETPARLPVSAEDHGPELDSLKLASQQSAITSENLSNAINHSLIAAASSQETHLSSSLSRLPLGQCNQPNSNSTQSTDAEGPLLHNLVELAAKDTPAVECKAVEDGWEKHRLESPLDNSSISALEKNLVASSPPNQSLPSCSNGADASLYATCASLGDQDSNEQSLMFPGIDSNPRGRASCKLDAASSLQSCESTDAASTSTAKELGSEQLAPDTIPWPDYVLVDGLDLTSCETNCGVYASAFDFSAEAMDRDSCTSRVALLEDQQYLSDDSTEFLLAMPDSSPLPLSPPQTRHGAQSSGSRTDATTDVDAIGDSSSPEQALWHSMDLTPLGMAS